MLWMILQGSYDLVDLLLAFAAYAALILVMMPVHEAAHGFAAYKLGDPTAKMSGRLTLNPMAHIDPLGAVLIMLCGIGYAKPVPVNPYYFRNRKRDMAMTALAGPLSNLAMAAISVGLFSLICRFSTSLAVIQGAMIVLLEVFASVNISLAVFNLLPIPPLDGSRIFGAILPERWTYWMDQYHQYVRMALLLLVFSGALSRPLNYLCNIVFRALLRAFGLLA